MGGSAFNLQQNSHGVGDHEEEYDDDQFDDLGFSSSSDDDRSSSTNSSSSDLVEDATTTTTSSSISDHQLSNNKGPLDEMSSLMHQLPFKRGLSKFYQGKSQSFTSLSNVRSLEDLAKPENPYSKRLKSCRSYGGLLISETHHQSKSSSSPPKAFSRAIAKKSSSSLRGTSCSSLSAKRSNSFLGLNRPPIPPQKTSTATTLCNQTPLFV